MLIFLTGFMGAGKTTVGKKLAGQLGYTFVDLDVAIELETNKTVAQLLEPGEMNFRKIESAVLKKVATLSNTVVSTGGGTPCFFDNMEWMNRHGLTIYLKLSAGSLYHRLSPIKSTRPMICKLVDADLMEYIMDKLVEREPFYSKAKITIKGESLKLPELLGLVQQELEKIS